MEDTLARDRVAAMVAATRYDQARSVLAPLVAREDAAQEDLLRATVIELKDGDLKAAQTFLTRVAAGHESAAVHFLTCIRDQVAVENLRSVQPDVHFSGFLLYSMSAMRFHEYGLAYLSVPFTWKYPISVYFK